MNIFKLYFKLLIKNKGIIIMYTIIFLGISIMNFSSTKSNNSFVISKPKVVVYDYDNKELTNEFVKYLETKSTIITNVKDNKDEIDNALYYEMIDAYIMIPKGFTDDVIKNNKLTLEYESRTSSANSYLVKEIITNYFDFCKAYNYKDYDTVADILNQTVKVDVISNNDNSEYSKYYFNILNFSIISISIYIFGLTLYSLKDVNIQKRNEASPVSKNKFFSIFLIGNILSMLVITLCFILCGMFLLKENFFVGNNLYYILNLFTFIIPIFVISFIIGIYVKSKEGISALTNILGLGTSFLCGVFVPLEYLSDKIVSVGKIFPSYWFIKNNDLIYNNTYTIKNAIPLFLYTLLFIVVFIFINRNKEKNKI